MVRKKFLTIHIAGGDLCKGRGQKGKGGRGRGVGGGERQEGERRFMGEGGEGRGRGEECRILEASVGEKERGVRGIRDKDGERGVLKGPEGEKGGVEGTRGRAKEVW